MPKIFQSYDFTGLNAQTHERMNEEIFSLNSIWNVDNAAKKDENDKIDSNQLMKNEMKLLN